MQRKTIFDSILTLGTGLIVIIFVYFLYIPLYNQLKERSQEITNKQKEIEVKAQTVEDLEKLQTKYNTRKADEEAIEKSIPTEEEVALIIRQINQIAQESKVFCNLIERKEIAEENGINKVNFTIEIGGSYEGFKKFLENIEKSNRIIDINSIQLTSINSESSYNFTVGASVYFQES
ncbi:hypothetical protein COY23_00795 [bacterium (Candidatus Torokbacteria) CG_4_10_14_0_2_um_filter_35_8]|nr:MAG: hypothetical protein COY23_00795 [bacterium (Candidatus Torokbacteria) CG_4_10_14_0_2_um_filter_35_8]